MQRGDSIELNFQGLEMHKWNISTQRAGRVDDKNGVIVLIIMSTPGVMVIKMSKIGSFFVFFADESKTLVTA